MLHRNFQFYTARKKHLYLRELQEKNTNNAVMRTSMSDTSRNNAAVFTVRERVKL